ncbi:MAG: tetratricopeptide repeat protein [Thermodesulfovibrionales bacterium]|nr:tetratricopeptide repeat protein [Thermodesulfovibrionales bacterium]
MNSRVAFIIAASLLTLACGGGPSATVVSQQVQRSNAHNVNARAAYERGDIALAMKLSSEALRLSRSVEDTEGTALNLLNIAAIYRVRDDRAAAHETLGELFNPAGEEYPEGLLARGCMLKALLYIDEGDLGEASMWADKAEELCKGSGCTSMAGAYNLKARVLLLRDNVEEAQQYAERGRRAGGGMGAETANSLRLLGDSYLALKEYGHAEKLYKEALALDKSLGLPPKIALDLKGMGEAAIGAGRSDKARGYLLRALDVSKSASVSPHFRTRDIENEIRVLLETLQQAEN